MHSESPRYILNHPDTIWRTLGNVQSVQILVTDRIGSVQNRFGISFSTFEVRPETFSRVRGRFSSIQNCIAMIRWIIGGAFKISGGRESIWVGRNFLGASRSKLIGEGPLEGDATLGVPPANDKKPPPLRTPPPPAPLPPRAPPPAPPLSFLFISAFLFARSLPPHRPPLRWRRLLALPEAQQRAQGLGRVHRGGSAELIVGVDAVAGSCRRVLRLAGRSASSARARPACRRRPSVASSWRGGRGRRRPSSRRRRSARCRPDRSSARSSPRRRASRARARGVRRAATRAAEAAELVGLEELQVGDVEQFAAAGGLLRRVPVTRRLYGCCLSAASRVVTLRLTITARLRACRFARNAAGSTFSSRKIFASGSRAASSAAPDAAARAPPPDSAPTSRPTTSPVRRDRSTKRFPGCPASASGPARRRRLAEPTS